MELRLEVLGDDEDDDDAPDHEAEVARDRETEDAAAHGFKDVHRDAEDDPGKDEQLAASVRALLMVMPAMQFFVSRIEDEHEEKHLGNGVRYGESVLRKELGDVGDHQEERRNIERQDECTLSGYHHESIVPWVFHITYCCVACVPFRQNNTTCA